MKISHFVHKVSMFSTINHYVPKVSVAMLEAKKELWSYLSFKLMCTWMILQIREMPLDLTCLQFVNEFSRYLLAIYSVALWRFTLRACIRDASNTYLANKVSIQLRPKPKIIIEYASGIYYQKIYWNVNYYDVTNLNRF